ncbi:hypothetical protein [Kocuria sp. NPDC057446]
MGEVAALVRITVKLLTMTLLLTHALRLRGAPEVQPERSSS